MFERLASCADTLREPAQARARRPRAQLASVLAAASALVACSGAAPPRDASSVDAVDASDSSTTCVDPATGPPSDVFCTGLYLNHDSMQHAPSAMPYTPGLTFWSDGAEKSRFLSLPPGTTIDTSNMDSWVFPVGTRVWKEFRVNGALVETRFYWKQSATSWVAATYIWDAGGQTARLGSHDTPTILPNGYEIPATRTCANCHNGGADRLLGIEAIALALPSAQGATLANLAATGRLSAPPAATTITLPEDATGHAAAALGYLHVNCGMACHSTRGVSEFTHFFARLRAEEFWPAAGAMRSTVASTDAYRTGVNAPVMLATYSTEFPGAQIITPGSHAMSLAWIAAHRRGLRQMPPVVSHQIDEAGTQLLADWIDALTP